MSQFVAKHQQAVADLRTVWSDWPADSERTIQMSGYIRLYIIYGSEERRHL